MQILRHADYRRMPWKNGLGVTEEVIAFPPGSNISNFGWRLSIAHVGADGPFSVFLGIDRTIALLDGDGLMLDLPNSRIVDLSPSGAPFAFSGDLDISSRNNGGPTIDLNIMTRRGQFAHDMRRTGGGRIKITDSNTILVFNTTANISCKSGTVSLKRFDAIIAEPDDGPIEVGSEADVLVIEITARQG